MWDVLLVCNCGCLLLCIVLPLFNVYCVGCENYLSCGIWQLSVWWLFVKFVWLFVEELSFPLVGLLSINRGRIMVKFEIIVDISLGFPQLFLSELLTVDCS